MRMDRSGSNHEHLVPSTPTKLNFPSAHQPFPSPPDTNVGQTNGGMAAGLSDFDRRQANIAWQGGGTVRSRIATVSPAGEVKFRGGWIFNFMISSVCARRCAWHAWHAAGVAAQVSEVRGAAREQCRSTCRLHPRLGSHLSREARLWARPRRVCLRNASTRPCASRTARSTARAQSSTLWRKQRRTRRGKERTRQPADGHDACL